MADSLDILSTNVTHPFVLEHSSRHVHVWTTNSNSTDNCWIRLIDDLLRCLGQVCQPATPAPCVLSLATNTIKVCVVKKLNSRFRILTGLRSLKLNCSVDFCMMSVGNLCRDGVRVFDSLGKPSASPPPKKNLTSENGHTGTVLV